MVQWHHLVVRAVSVADNKGQSRRGQVLDLSPTIKEQDHDLFKIQYLCMYERPSYYL